MIQARALILFVLMASVLSNLITGVFAAILLGLYVFLAAKALESSRGSLPETLIMLFFGLIVVGMVVSAFDVLVKALLGELK